MCLFVGNVASRGASDAMVMIEMRQSCEPESIQSRINARG